ncbi:MAG: PAAR domain-containing protein [Myxococcota bacterium]
MGNRQAREGDLTLDGGILLNGCENIRVNQRRAITKNSTHRCPSRGTLGPVVSGSTTVFYNSKPASRVDDHVICIPEDDEEIEKRIDIAIANLSTVYGSMLEEYNASPEEYMANLEERRTEQGDYEDMMDRYESDLEYYELEEKDLEVLDRMIEIQNDTGVWIDPNKEALGSNVFSSLNRDALALVARVSGEKSIPAGRSFAMWIKEQQLGLGENDITEKGRFQVDGRSEKDARVAAMGRLYGEITRLDAMVIKTTLVQRGDDGSLDTRLIPDAHHDKKFRDFGTAVFLGDSETVNNLLKASLESIDIVNNEDGTWVATPTMDFYAVSLEVSDALYRHYEASAHGSHPLTAIRWTVSDCTYNEYTRLMMRHFNVEHASDLEDIILSAKVDDYQSDLVELSMDDEIGIPNLKEYASKSYDSDSDGEGDTYDISKLSRIGIASEIERLGAELLYEVAFRCGDRIETGSNNVFVGA